LRRGFKLIQYFGHRSDQDLWQSAILGFGVVGSSQPVVQATLQKVIDFVDDMGLVQMGDSQVEFFYC
jgi:uncharacterized protein YlxP (DUF503 family)